jgi:hypothetical protein
LVTEYLQAVEEKNRGDKTKYRNFRNQRLAKPWDQSFTFDVRKAFVEAYNVNEAWGNRVMAIDVQKGFFYYVVIAFGMNGEARRLAHGKALTYEELRQIQTDFQIPDIRVGIDCGSDETSVASSVARFASPVKFKDQYGRDFQAFQTWLLLRGDKRLEWNVEDPKTKQKLSRPYSAGVAVNYLIGKPHTNEPLKPIYKYFWSNRRLKDITSNIRDGKTGRLIVDKADAEWEASMYSEALGAGSNPEVYSPLNENNPQNHMWDCLNMCVLLGLMFNLLTIRAE